LVNKIRVYELAKLLKMSAKDLMEVLEKLGIEAKTHMSSIDVETAKLVEDMLKKEDASAPSKAAPAPQRAVRRVSVAKGATVAELAKALGVPVGDAVSKLVKASKMLSASDRADDEALLILGEAYGVELEWGDGASDQGGPAPSASPEDVRPERMVPRPPVVTVMGHVDHGKTTLLDTIRRTNRAAKEAGGITQHIGASLVEHGGRRIVFLDTPGHEAFTTLRARGAKVTDVAVLVVAADDGVMPQTEEAISHARAAGVPIVVAINKIDKPGVDVERVKRQLSERGLIPEEWGGDTVMVPVSAKTGKGVEELLEMILLVADMLELKADPHALPRGYIIESRLDKGRGPVGSVIVQHGTLRVGDVVLTSNTYAKVRSMLDDRGNYVKEAPPGTPVEVSGFEEVPVAGDTFVKVSSEREAKAILESKKEQTGEAVKPSRVRLEDLYRRLQEGEAKQLRLILKADTQGSLEAIESSIRKMARDEVGVEVVHKGIGNVSESDVMLAAASDAIVLGFNVQVEKAASRLAEDEGVDVRTYRIIYEMLDDVKAALEGLLEPERKEEVVGKAEIRAIFKLPKGGKVAGCYVLEGFARRNASVRVRRGKEILYEGRLASLKRFKDDVREVASGFECGMAFEGFQDFQEGDLVEFFVVSETRRTLG